MLILKVVGFVLLGILALLLLIVSAVLFVPIRYRAEFTKQDKDMSGKAVATWLFGIGRLKAFFKDGELTYFGRIAFRKLGEDKKKPPKKNIKKKTREDGAAEEKQEEKTSAQKASAEKAQTNVNEKRSETSAKSPVKSPEHKKTKEKKKRAKSDKKEGLSTFQKIRNLIRNRDEAAAILKSHEAVILKSLKRIRKLLLHILPKKVRGYAEFGFDDPSTTGKVLGGLSALYGMTGPLLDLRPDFRNKVFNCDLYIKGRIRIFTVALILLLLYFNKELKETREQLEALSERSEN